MNRGFCLFSLMLIVTAGKALNAEEPGLEEMPPALKNQAVVLDFAVRVLEQNQTEVWNEGSQKVTIPGRPVSIKLVGANVVVAVQFTPYLRRRGQNFLVAQGQIWVDIPNQGIRYQTTVQTIPLDFDEPIYFFPLGSAAGNNGGAHIEIMLTMKPYREAAAEETTRAAAGNNNSGGKDDSGEAAGGNDNSP
ncbi:MAG: hypothetical protein LBJ90_06550 [Treponema sp.]|jgi:hypothetical protein|nr:hypothetical protein [Treponema sp.]